MDCNRFSGGMYVGKTLCAERTPGTGKVRNAAGSSSSNGMAPPFRLTDFVTHQPAGLREAGGVKSPQPWEPMPIQLRRPITLL